MSLPIFACVSVDTAPNCIELDSELTVPDSALDLEKLMTMDVNSVESDGRRLRYLPVIGIPHDNTVGKSSFKGNIEKTPLSWKNHLLPKQFDEKNADKVGEFHSKRPVLLYDAFSESRHTTRCDVGVTMLDKDFYRAVGANGEWSNYYDGKCKGVNFVKSNVVPLSDDTEQVSITPFAIYHFEDVMDLVDCSKVSVRKTEIASPLGTTFTDRFKAINKGEISKIYHASDPSESLAGKIVTMSDWMSRLSADEKRMDLKCRLNFKKEEGSEVLLTGCLTTQFDTNKNVISSQLVCEHRTSEIVCGTGKLSESLNVPREQDDCRLWSEHYDGAMLRCVGASYVARKLYGARKLSSTLAYVMVCDKSDRFWGVEDGLVQRTYDAAYLGTVRKNWSDRAISEDDNLETFSKIFANILDDTDEGKALFARVFSSGIRLGEYVAHTVIKGEPSELVDMRGDRMMLIFDLMVENCVVERTVDDVLTSSKSKVVVPDFFASISSVLVSEKDRIPTQAEATKKLSSQIERGAVSALCGKVTTQWLQHCYVKRDLFAPSPAVLKSGGEFKRTLLIKKPDFTLITETVANDVTYAYKNALSAYTNAIRLSGNNKVSSQNLGVLTFVKTLCHRTLIRKALEWALSRQHKNSTPRIIVKMLSDLYRLSTFPYGEVKRLFEYLVAEKKLSLDAVSQWFQDYVDPAKTPIPLGQTVAGNIYQTIRIMVDFSNSAEVVSALSEIQKAATATTPPPYDDVFFEDIRGFCDKLCMRTATTTEAKYWNHNRQHETYPQTGCVAMGDPGLDPIPLMRIMRLIRNAADGVFTFGANPEDVFDDLSLSFGNGQTLVAMCKIKSADKVNLERTLSPVAKERLKEAGRYAIYGCDSFVPENSSWRPYAFLPGSKKSDALRPHDSEFELWTSLEFAFAPKTLHLISDKSRAIMYDGNTLYDWSSEISSYEKGTDAIKTTMSLEYCKHRVFEALSVSKKTVELYPMPMIPNIYMGDATYELTAKYNIIVEGIKCVKYIDTMGVTAIGVPTYLQIANSSSSGVAVNIRDIYKKLLIDKCVVKSALESLSVEDNETAIKLEWHEGVTYFGERSKICDADALVDGAMLSSKSDGKLTATLFAVKRYPNHASRVAKEALKDIDQGIAGESVFSEYALTRHRLEKKERLRSLIERGLTVGAERQNFIDAYCAYDSGYGLSFGPLAEYKCALDCDAPDPSYEMGAYVGTELAATVKYSELCDKIVPRSSFSSASDLVSVYKVVVVTVAKVSDIEISETLSIKQDKVCLRDVLSNKDEYTSPNMFSPNYRGIIFAKTFGFLSERFYFDTEWFEPIKIARLSTVARNNTGGRLEYYNIFGNFLNKGGAVDFPKFALSGCISVEEYLKKTNIDGGARFETLCHYFDTAMRETAKMDDNYGDFEGFNHDIRYKRTDRYLAHAQRYLKGLKTLLRLAVGSKNSTRRNPEMARLFVDLDTHSMSFLHFYKNDVATKSDILKKYATDLISFANLGPSNNFLKEEGSKKRSNRLLSYGEAMLPRMLTLSATRGFDEGCSQYSQDTIAEDARTGLPRKATMSGIFWESEEPRKTEPLAYLYGTETSTFGFERDFSKMSQQQKGVISERMYRRTARLMYETVHTIDDGVAEKSILDDILKNLSAPIDVSIIPPTRLADQITGLQVRCDNNVENRFDFPISFDGRFSIAQMRVFVNDRTPNRLAKMFPSSEVIMNSETLRDEMVTRASTHAKHCDEVFKLTPSESYDILSERLVEKTAKSILMSVAFEYTKITRKGDAVVESLRCDADCFERFPCIDTLRILISTIDAILDTLKEYQRNMDVNTSGYDPLLLFSNIINGAFELHDHDHSPMSRRHDRGHYYTDRLLDEKTLCLLCLSSQFDCWVSPTTKSDTESPDVTVSKTSAAAPKKYDNLQWVGVYPSDYLTCPWSRNTSVSLLEAYLVKLKSFYAFMYGELMVACRAFATEAYEKSLVSSGFLDRNDGGNVKENVSVYMSARRSAFESSFLPTRRGFQNSDPRFNGTEELGAVLVDLDFENTASSDLESMEKICENYTLVEWVNLFKFVSRRNRKGDYNPKSQQEYQIAVFDEILGTAFSKSKRRTNHLTTGRDYWIAKAVADTISSKVQIKVDCSITATLVASSEDPNELASLSVLVSEGYSFDATLCLSSLLELTEKKYFGGQSELPHLAFLNHNWKMLSPSPHGASNAAFDERCLELWLTRGEYTVNKYWHKAFKMAGGTWVLDTLVANNMFVVERFIYPLFEELSKYKTEDYHRAQTLNSYAQDVMLTLKTLHVQMLNNVYSEVVYR